MPTRKQIKRIGTQSTSLLKPAKGTNNNVQKAHPASTLNPNGK